MEKICYLLIAMNFLFESFGTSNSRPFAKVLVNILTSSLTGYDA